LHSSEQIPIFSIIKQEWFPFFGKFKCTICLVFLIINTFKYSSFTLPIRWLIYEFNVYKNLCHCLVVVVRIHFFCMCVINTYNMSMYSLPLSHLFRQICLASYLINLLDLDLLSVCPFSNNYRLATKEESKWTSEWVGKKEGEEKA